MGTGNYDPAYVEDFHGILMDKFHEFRRQKVGHDIKLSMTGGDLNNIIAKAKTELYRKRPDAEKAGYRKKG